MTSTLTIFSETDPNTVIFHSTNRNEIRAKLKEIGIQYDVWPIDSNINDQSTKEEIMAAYKTSAESLITSGGYKTFDVISLNPDHPDKDTLRQKFLSEHIHAEDEVRFFVAGSGLFTVHKNGQVFNMLCVQGDLINVPANTPHWFDMGSAPSFVAIRIFNNPEGWVAQFTGSDIANKFPRMPEIEKKNRIKMN